MGAFYPIGTDIGILCEFRYGSESSPGVTSAKVSVEV